MILLIVGLIGVAALVFGLACDIRAGRRAADTTSVTLPPAPRDPSAPPSFIERLHDDEAPRPPA